MLRGERVRSHIAIIDKALENEYLCNCERHRKETCSTKSCE
jgi:hypothetical protein